MHFPAPGLVVIRGSVVPGGGAGLAGGARAAVVAAIQGLQLILLKNKNLTFATHVGKQSAHLNAGWLESRRRTATAEDGGLCI